MLEKVAEMGNKGVAIKDMYEKEIKVQNIVIHDLKKEIKGYKHEIENLTLKLKVPSLQKKFLEEHGKLDEFIDAKQLGQEPAAKWCLMNAAKEELNEIQEKIEARIKAEQEAEDSKQVQRKPLKTVYNKAPNKETFIVTSSINKDMELDKNVFDIKF